MQGKNLIHLIENEQKNKTHILKNWVLKWLRHMERHLISFIITEMVIKFTMNCHLPHFRIAIFKRMEHMLIKISGWGVNWSSHHKNMNFLPKIQNRAIVQFRNSLLGMFQRTWKQGSGVTYMFLRFSTFSTLTVPKYKKNLNDHQEMKW